MFLKHYILISKLILDYRKVLFVESVQQVYLFFFFYMFQGSPKNIYIYTSYWG